MKTIGVIGVGTMGRGMVANLAKNEYSVLAYARNKEKIQDVQSAAIEVTDSLEQFKDADVVITCLPSDAALDDVFFNRNLFEVAKGKVFIDSGTTSIALTQKIAKKCEEHNIKFLDAPVTGSKLGAQNGTMTYMIGGPKEVYEKCLPVLKAMGKVHVHCGPHTYGQRAKIALNMTQALLMEGYFEGLVFGVKQGVSLDAMQQVLENSAAKNGVGTFKLPYIKKRDFDQHFMLKLMHKDLKLAHAQMENIDAKLPLAHQICDIFGKSMDRGDEDFCTIVKELEKNNDVEIK